MLKYLLLLCLTFALIVSAEEPIEADDEQEVTEEASEQETKKAKIQILNKITAKAQYIDVDIDSQITLSTLKIKVLKCLRSSPYELSENKTLLEISEKKIGQDHYTVIFEGWMFSSSPAIASLEHAVYDVTAVECYNN